MIFMDQLLFYSLVLPAVFSIVILLVQKLNRTTNQQCKTKPPGPPPLPIIGHLHKLKQPLHRTLQEFSYKYGSIYSLRFGYRPVVIISCPAAVEECFTKNDKILANRPQILAGKHLNYDFTTLGAANYGPLWRNLRKVTTLEFFSTIKLNLLTDIREQETEALVQGLLKECSNNNDEEFVKVDMRDRLSELSFNIVMRMVTGKRYFGPQAEGLEEAKVFRGVIRDVFDLTESTPADFFPFLRWFDYGNVEKKMLNARKKMDAFFDGLIEECRRTANDKQVDEGKRTPFIYTLLKLQQSDPINYSDQIIKGIIMIMLTAGTDTSSITLEWALSLLLNHPKKLEKARLEIDNWVGKHTLVNESHIPKLPFIHNIINETLRLFPAAPLLAGHEPSEDITIAGCHIEKGTMLMVNAWAIHRDPTVWDDPLAFEPERFESFKCDDYRLTLVPFGLGRRSCPGAPLANRVIALALAALIQCFDWHKVNNEQLDMTEGSGLTMPKAIPLQAMCRVRQGMSRSHILSELV